MMLRDAVPSPLPPDRQQTHLSKNKRTRTAFSQAQQDKLELAYHANPYPDGFYRQKVAQDVGIPEDRIQVQYKPSMFASCVPVASIEFVMKALLVGTHTCVAGSGALISLSAG